MKYLKQYETYIEIFLDDDDQLFLMLEYINNNDSDKIKKLFIKEFDPNTKQGREPIVMNLINKTENININILNLFIEFGLTVDIITSFLYNSINWYNKKTDKLNLLESSRICIKSGANLFYEYGRNENIFDVIDDNDILSDKFRKELYKMIQYESPNEYNKYITEKEININSSKFNL